MKDGVSIAMDIGKGLFVACAMIALMTWAFRPTTGEVPARFSVSSEAGNIQVIRDGVSGVCWGIFTNRHLSVATFGPIPCE